MEIPDEIIDWESVRCWRLLRVRDYVRENLRSSLTLAEVAAVAGMERTYFCSYFRGYTGVSYSTWRTWERVRSAAELFENPRLSIAEVTDRVGFRDVRTLERSFRRLLNVTPGVFCRQLVGRGPACKGR